MPIVDVEIVGPLPAAAGLVQELADRIGEVLGSTPGGTWVRVHDLPPARYAENEAEVPEPPPVFVRVLCRRLPEIAARAAEVEALARAVAAVLDRPVERIHVVYDLPGAGRVAFGGRLVE